MSRKESSFWLMTHPHLHPPPYRFLYVESVIRGANEIKLELILWHTIYDTACLQILNLHSCWSLAVLLLSIQVHHGHYSVQEIPTSCAKLLHIYKFFMAPISNTCNISGRHTMLAKTILINHLVISGQLNFS